ncbi:helix-turn-helix domain-containing protein [Thalassococcus sp. BH17M4-6]|uniref:helix-turn-helix domain-containing protein n=1 Tax=Thalassococcus sp. BH17M4-6 TaxID=3413148 RepID=UPI003BCC6276
MTSPDAFTDFGKAVRAARTAKGWTLEMLAHEALGNQDRKSYVSRVERGKQPLSPLTIQKFAKALDLPKGIVDAALGIAPQVEDAPSQTDADADRLYDELQGLRNQLKLSESLAIALAYEYAEGNPTDLETALRELRRAFEVAADRRDRLPGNVDAAVNAIIAEVDRRNEEESPEDAGAYLLRELAASRDAMAEKAQGHVRLIDKGLAQAVLTRDVDMVVTLEVEKLTLDSAADGFDALRDVWRTWYERGRDMGLAFDLEVSIGLARASVDRAQGQDQGGAALNDLAIALCTLGERESGTARLEGAVVAFRAALEERTRDRVPLDWAKAQANLGNALQTLGARESGTARLEEAVAAYRAALEEMIRDRVPLDWAMTQMNLGTALATLGERESGTARLEEAVAAYRAALEERTRDRVPLDWAMTQMNLGNALRTLGARESGTARLEEAVAAYRAALEERTRDRVPFDWATTLHCFAVVEISLFDKTGNAAHLDAAKQHADAAREVYLEGGASHYVEWIETQQLAEIAKRRG